MGKYEKRRVFRAYRKAKVPFLLAAWLSRKDFVEMRYRETLPAGFTAQTVTYCECCGPVLYRVTEEKTGRSWDFDHFTGRPE